MDYENIFKQAGIIAWKHKILWLFGILAGCGASTGGGNSGWSRSFSNSGGGFGDLNENTSGLPPEMERALMEFGNLIEQNAEILGGALFALICFGLLLNFVFFVIRSYGFVNLTAATTHIERKGLESVNFQTVSDLGNPFVTRMIGLNLLLAIPGFVFGLLFFLLIIGSVFGSGGDPDAIVGVILLLVCCLGCISIFIGITINMIGTMARTALVVDDLSIIESIKEGWTVLKDNFGSYFILWLMVLVLGVLIGMVMVIPALIVAGPAMAMFFSQGPELFLENMSSNLIKILGLSILIWPFTAILRGIVTTFTTNIWTLAYLDVAGEEPLNPPISPTAEFPDFGAPLVEGE